MIKQIKTALILLIILTMITGGLYPLLVAGLAQILFPFQANGSLLVQDRQIIGSFLIGQAFTNERYFWSRPSATPLFPYNATHSSGSNLAPSNPALLQAVKTRITWLREKHPETTLNIPAELVTTSASGLDPEISLLGAYYQASRVAKARGVSEIEIKKIIEQCIIQPSLGLLGNSRINVLELNLALDQRENINHA